MSRLSEQDHLKTLSSDEICCIGQTLNEHRAGMNVDLIEAPDLEEFEKQVKNRPYMGMPSGSVNPIKPPRESFVYSEDDLLPKMYCCIHKDLVPLPAATPPQGRSYPLSPTWNYVQDHRYRSRFVYAATYHLRDLAAHRERLLVTDTPPNIIPTKVDGRYVAGAVPGMVQMVPGIPFVYHIDGNPDATHTVACLHTLESLRPYPCFPKVLELSIQLSKLSWGCQAHDRTSEITRICCLPGLKRNDRSKKVSSTSSSSDGSYSLANTVLEGEGQGTVLPAVQVDTREARTQIASVLKCLHGLFRAIMPLCVSKFEFEISDFHSLINNVMSFGGLAPNGSGCQLNASSLGKILSQMIGPQGSWHTDSKDDLTRLTLFILLLMVSPNGHPGSFCLGRPGLYIRELNVWIIFLAFKGNDIHSGFAPVEDLEDHQKWVDSIAAPAWDHAGPENRIGYVIYPSGPAIQRHAAMNTTPSQLFGNFGSAQPHKTGQHTFAKHGQVTLGDQDDWANRLGREVIGSFFNHLSQCNLDLNLDVNELLQSISFKRNEDGVSVPLKPLPYHPAKDADHIALYRGYYQHYREQCLSLHIHIDRKAYARLRDTMREQDTAAAMQSIYHLAERQSLAATFPSTSDVEIEEVVARTLVAGKACFVVRLRNHSDTIHLEESTLKGNPKVIQFLQRNQPSLLLPRIQIPDPVAEGTPSTLPAVELQSTIYEIESALSTSALSKEGLPDGNASIPSVLLPPTFQPPATTCSTDITDIQSSAHQSEALPPDDISANVPSTSGKKKKLESTANQPNPSPRRTRAQTHKQKTGNSDIPAVHTTLIDSPLTSELSDADIYETNDDMLGDQAHELYDVEDILEFGYQNDIAVWKIKWEGYDETTWEPEHHLMNCLHKLHEFNRIHNIVILKPPSAEQNHESGKKAGRGKPSDSPIVLSRNLDRLEKLLDLPQLKSELWDLAEASALSKTKPYFTNSDTNTMVSTWTNHNHIHSMLGSYVSVLSDDQCSVAGILLYRLLHSVQILPSLVSDSQKLAVILRAQHWEMCRSLMVVFNWYRDAGPKTAEHVLNIHRVKGYHQLKKESPMLADFVDHIVWYVYEEQAAWLENKREMKSKKRSKGIKQPKERPTVNAGSSKFGTRPSDPRKLPYDLCGLRPAKRHEQAISLQGLRTFSGGHDELYAKSNTILQEVWTSQLIVPALKSIDAAFSSTRRKATASEDILNRCITRGAILQCIADACGTDAIFASTAVKEFLASPSLVFETRIHQENRFVKHALRDAISTLEPLFDWLTTRISETPEILEVAEQIGDLTHLHMLELSAGRPLLLEQTRSPTRSALFDAAVAAPRTEHRKRTQIFSEVSLMSLLPNSTTVGIGVMGLIVREALAAHRSLHTTDEILRRVLEGKHATQSAASSHNPDHTDPIRQFSFGAKLLYRHLPAAKLTKEAGLSNLLSWLGTGQGFVTQSFLKSVEPRGGFYAEDLATMVNQFQNAVSTNWYLIEQRNYSSKSTSKSRQHKKIPELIVIHDVHIWGQASNHLALLPTYHAGARRGSKYTVDDKFSQYFTSAVQENWKKALGDMLHQDTSTYSRSRQTWGYYHRMVKDLNIPGFQQGLTVFQLANYLVFLGIAKMPEWMEVADFVAENRNKGAFRGLEKLGFHLTDSASVRAAFYCIHHHLEEYLTDEDKQILGFSPLFTEHLLCKVVRWAKHLLREGDIDFYEKGLNAESTSTDWKAELNQTDNTAFPFPLTINRESLEKAIKDAAVRIIMIDVH